MLKKLIDAVNVSSLKNKDDAYKFIQNSYPTTSKDTIKNLLNTPELSSFDLTIGTDKIKIDLLRKELIKNSFSAYILSTNDEFISEYTPLYAKRLFYITGFSGSYGYAIITEHTAAIFVDGRYKEQANNQVDTSIFEVLPLSYNNIISYCEKNLDKNSSIAINAKTNSCEFTNILTNKLKLSNIDIKFLDYDLVDKIWKKQPPKPISPIVSYPIEYSGESISCKLNKVINYLNIENLDILFVTALDNISWLLNIRGNDIECSPFNLAILIVNKNGNIDFLVNMKKVLPNIAKYFVENKINVSSYNDLNSKLSLLKNLNIGINVDSPYYYYSYLNKISKVKILKQDFISNLKSVKNKVEIQNSYKAHIKDGAALTKLIIWLNSSVTNKKSLNELDVINKIDSLKATIVNYKDNSFPSIVAANSNAAYPHYQTTEISNCNIDSNTILLIDCGAQYLEGTTDVTRTLTFAEPTLLFKKHFTLVLKGLIALSNIKFPKNTPCCNLDTLARQYLWEHGLDYAHGTGHGVGHYLSVHEGPIRFNQNCFAPLKEGMIISIEPGYYKVDHYGIRLENLVIVQESKVNENFLEFDTLTLAPIDKKNIDYSILSKNEILWLEQYHNKVLTTLSSYLNREELIALKNLIN